MIVFLSKEVEKEAGGKTTWSRAPGQMCRIPTELKSELPTPNMGCLILSFSADGRFETGWLLTSVTPICHILARFKCNNFVARALVLLIKVQRFSTLCNIAR